MPKFILVAQHIMEVEYEVEAESAETARAMFSNGSDIGEGMHETEVDATLLSVREAA